MSHSLRLVTFIFCAISLFAVNSHADIFRWVDEQGRIHFTDKPPPQAESQSVTLRINSFTSPSIEPFQFDESLISKRVVTPDVIMYSTSWCGYCKQARRYFNQKQIAFTEYDVEKTDKGKQDFKRLGGKGVPVILVGDRRLNGFSKRAFEQIYQR